MKTIETEVVETAIVKLVQKPIIAYDLIEAKGKEVLERITSLDIDNINPTEDNLRLIKSTRTELGREFKTLEEARKAIKEKVMKPYDDFNDAYTKHISKLFKDADAKLKQKADEVDDKILSLKIDNIKSYFEDKNTFNFLKFEDMELKIIKSTTDKKLHSEIDNYLLGIKNNIDMIESMDNSDRTLAKFQMYKDVNRAVMETNQELQREKEIKEQKEAQEKARIEAENRQKEAVVEPTQEEYHDNVNESPCEALHREPIVEDPKIFKARFEAVGAIENIKKLKAYADSIGVQLFTLKD